MLVFADNDILIKLAGCSLLDRFLRALSHPEIRIAPTTRFSLPKQAKRQIRDQGVAESLCAWVRELQDTDAVQNVGRLDRLSAFHGIDAGESILFSAVCEADDSARLVTGDRRSLRALLVNQQQLQVEVSQIAGKVYTLESAFLLLIEQYGFADVDETMGARSVDDKVLDMAFGPGRNVEHARQCLSSAAREVLPLLAHPDLVVPLE